MADTAEDKKPNVGAEKQEGGSSEQMNIRVRDSDGNEVQFKIKKSTRLEKLMNAYCSRMGVQPGAYRFLFDGHRIKGEDTPQGLEMDDLDCVDAMLFQQGGAL